MNRVKLTIKTEDGKMLCKFGTSTPAPKGEEYSDAELAALMKEMSRNLITKADMSAFGFPLDKDWSDAEMKVVAVAEAVPVKDTAKQIREKAEAKTATQVKSLEENCGWVFMSAPGYHPHSNSTWTDYYFKSPRMLNPGAYHAASDLILEEAIAMSNCFAKDICCGLNSDVRHLLTEYFKNNPQATEAPTVNVTLHQ